MRLRLSGSTMNIILVVRIEFVGALCFGAK